MTIVHPFGAKPISKAKVASYTANFAKRGSNANKENIPSSSQPAAHIPSPQPPSTSSPSPELIQQKKLAKNQRRTLVRAQKKVSDLKETIVGLKAEHTVALRETQLTIANLQADTVTLRSRIEGLETHIEDAFKSTTQYQANIAALKKRIARFGSVIQTTVKRTKRKAQSTRSKVTAHRGVYNTEARDLARRLRLAGCAPSKIGPLIVRIAASFGVQVTKQMSRRTVQRCMLEALAASDIQLVEEMGQNEGHTLSQDSTSNRSINYQAHQLTMRVPDYDGGETVPDPKSIPRTRLLRVASTVDHTAPTSVAMWIDLLQASLETYNNSPMARRASKSFSLRKFAMKMKGMCSDHASAEKAAFDLLKGKMDMLELLVFLSDRKSALIESLGGMEKWDELGDVVQSEHEAQLLKDLKDELGRKEYDSMPPEARSALNLFIWAGCCMHKDQNSFKGGAEAMGLSWALAGLTLPLILANKASAAKIRDILNPGRKDAPLTPEEEEAIAASTRGGVKAAALIHLFAAFGLKESHRFPDTSNTRFTTYGLAACELLKHLDFYRSFLDDARLRKQRVGWTNIELNLYNALHDAPTLTELAVMALYTQSVTHPYLRVVRGSGEDTVNALDLGPFHLKVRSHCEAIIANPDLLIAPDASFEKGSLDGKDFEGLL
ncbi:hypothetical protein DFP72DRAFT_907726 [Ephemerocybe angulata]|uniref:Uncharacterized protein n=1 Tax=Ephemerocybe angulata TaxID=980116 RepID=A0A8H6HRI4_9AGAR|nr:hypothetical protein DFP72DRAFT_907726 [Tulosesus angulatus]